MTLKKWDIVGEKADDIISVLLENRKLTTKKEIDEFLNPKLEDVTIDSVGIDPKQLKIAIARIKKAIADKEQIIVYGDYDVDGICGAAILWETLHRLGAKVLPYIPHRIDEGYGLSEKGILDFQTEISDTKLIITVDNGIVANDAVEFAEKQGIDVIITDHHVPSEKLPKALAIVHTTKLCGTGVGWMLARDIRKECHPEQREGSLANASSNTLRDSSATPQNDTPMIDVCGTGGDGVGAFNISTAASFVVAACGVKVAKHGNRAASSKCGSADVLEALGVHIMLIPQQAAAVLKKVGMVFLFAPLYHPAMKQIGPIRKELGVRTVFNFLGPFLNPAGVKRQLIGVPNVAIAKKLAAVAAKLGYQHALIISSADGMDEISLSGPTHIFEVRGKKVISKVINPLQFGMKKTPLSQIVGGDAAQNSAILLEVLEGKKSSYRDIAVLNSAAALYVAGTAKTIKEGIGIAEKAIDSGKAKEVLEKLIEETKKYA